MIFASIALFSAIVTLVRTYQKDSFRFLKIMLWVIIVIELL